MAKVSLDLNEIKNNIKSSALLAAKQINELAKKAQKDLSEKEVGKQLNKILDAAKQTKIEDIINNPKVQKLINNPRVQDFLKNEKVQDFINNPKVKEMRNKFFVAPTSTAAAPAKPKAKKTASKKDSSEE